MAPIGAMHPIRAMKPVKAMHPIEAMKPVGAKRHHKPRRIGSRLRLLTVCDRIEG
jgi:hypothetical protein